MSTDGPQAPSIDDDEVLHRRIHPEFVKPDGSPSSQAFTDDNMSVDRAIRRTARETIEGYSGFGVAALVTSPVRALGLKVIPDLLVYNDAHALVQGKKTRAISRKLARMSSMVIVPNDRNSKDSSNPNGKPELRPMPIDVPIVEDGLNRE